MVNQIPPNRLAAILFSDPDKHNPESVGGVFDIIYVEGVNAAAKRRLRRRVISRHGLMSRTCYNCYDRIVYETYINGEQVKTEDVSKRYMEKLET